MAVIEIAALPFAPKPDDPKFLSTLKNGLDIQTKWLAEIHPEKPLLNNPVSVCYKNVDEPEYVILAKWESLEAHGEWIQSKENQGVMGSLLPYLVDKDRVSLVHIDASADEFVHLPNSPFVVIQRWLVGTGKGDIIERIEASKEGIKSAAAEHRVVGNWRVDGEPGEKEYILISGWNEVDGWEKAVSHSNGHFDPAAANVKVYERLL